jgi:hypothetical protein
MMMDVMAKHTTTIIVDDKETRHADTIITFFFLGLLSLVFKSLLFCGVGGECGTHFPFSWHPGVPPSVSHMSKERQKPKLIRYSLNMGIGQSCRIFY